MKKIIVKIFWQYIYICIFQIQENMFFKLFWVLVWLNSILDKDELIIFGYFQRKGKYFVFINGIDDVF